MWGASVLNAALFAGIGAFADSESGLNPLRYAPADAIALAHLFTQELKLVPPQRAWLALSYAADSLPPAAQAQLATLKTSGVNLLVADKSRILAQLSRISRMADNPDDAILVTFSSHGYEKDGQAYLMPRDGLRQHLRDTGIALDTVTATLQDSRAGKKIMIIDACRELPPGVAGGTRGDDAMSAGLQQAFIAAKGVARLISCKAQQQSWEAPDLQLGVYTHFLIEALRGRARPDERGYIRLGSVLQYASASTEAWVKRNRGREQTPWSECDEQARDIPLAVSTATREALDSLQKRRGSALELLEAARRADRERISAVMVDEVDKASRQWTGKPLDDLLDQLELLRGNTPAARANFARYWADASGAAARADETRRQAEAKQLADAQRRADEAERLRKEAEERARQAEKIRAERPSQVPAGFRAESADGYDQSSRLPYTIVHEQTGYRLKLVPAGEFNLGSADWADTQPLRRIHLDAYWIGETEVTCAQFVQFLNEKGNQTEGGVTWCGLAGAVKIEHSGGQFRVKSGGGNHPVVELSWFGARAFARWMGGDLPTEPQWEKAAKGGREVLWPWGSQWDRKEANTAERIADVSELKTVDEWRKWWEPYQRTVLQRTDGYSDTTVPVSSYRANGYGLFDMAGNVWEWCMDYYAAAAYEQLRDGQRNPPAVTKGDQQTVEYWQGGEKKTEQQECRVVRGGGWLDQAHTARCAYRNRLQPTSRSNGNGVRVVVLPRP